MAQRCANPSCAGQNRITRGRFCTANACKQYSKSQQCHPRDFLELKNRLASKAALVEELKNRLGLPMDTNNSDLLSAVTTLGDLRMDKQLLQEELKTLKLRMRKKRPRVAEEDGGEEVPNKCTIIKSQEQMDAFFQRRT